MAAVSEVVVYVTVGEHPAMAGIAAGSGIVGERRGEAVAIYYEGALYGQVGMRSLADRVFYAHGRMRERYPTLASRVVPREALVVVGIFDPALARSCSPALIPSARSRLGSAPSGLTRPSCCAGRRAMPER